MMIDSSVTEIRGIGPKKAAALEKLGIRTVDDLLRFQPRTYEDRRNPAPISELEPGMPAFVKGVVVSVLSDPRRYSRKRVLKVLAEDSTGRMEVVFFNAPFLAGDFVKGEEYCFYGRPSANKGHIQMIHPEFSKAGGAREEIVPVYPLTAGITQYELRRLEREAADLAADADDFMPPDIIRGNGLCSLPEALRNIHFPHDRT